MIFYVDCQCNTFLFVGFEADTVKLDALHDYLEFVKVSNCGLSF